MSDGVFAGKYTLASVDPSAPTVYATASTQRGAGDWFPEMAAPRVGRNETWIAYTSGNGVILQMGNLWYLKPDDRVGIILASRDRSDASTFRWREVDPHAPKATTTLEIDLDNEGWQPVRYRFAVDMPTYLAFPLKEPGTDVDPGTFTTFARTTITPALAVIQSTKSAPGADLRDVDLTGADLSGVDLTGADLTGAILDGATITGAKLNGATLVGASLRCTDFTGTPLDGAAFDGTDVSEVIWGKGSCARGASFIGCTGISAAIGSQEVADWSNADLRGAVFSRADFTNVDLSGAKLQRAVLVGAILDSTDLSSATLGGTTKSAAAVLSYAYLTNVSFTKTNCFGVSFAFASLFGALTNLTETATLEQADFANAYLEAIHLGGATLRGSNFDNACLIGADLTNADLRPTTDGSTRTSLAGACVQGTNFERAKLQSVDLTGATVAFTKGKFKVQMCDPILGRFDQELNYKPTAGLDLTTLQPDTICPNGITLQANRQRGTKLHDMLALQTPATTWVAVSCMTSPATGLEEGTSGESPSRTVQAGSGDKGIDPRSRSTSPDPARLRAGPSCDR